MDRVPISVLASTVTLNALVGCVQTVPVTPNVACDFRPLAETRSTLVKQLFGSAPSTTPTLPLDTVSITDIGITNKVQVQDVLATRTATGTVQVAARLVNCTDFPLQVEGRTHFLNEAQMDAEPVTAWTRVFLPPRAVSTYSERSAQVDEVVHYLIEIREGI
jgi:hypothetical protein